MIFRTKYCLKIIHYKKRIERLILYRFVSLDGSNESLRISR